MFLWMTKDLGVKGYDGPHRKETFQKLRLAVEITGEPRLGQV